MRVAECIGYCIDEKIYMGLGFTVMLNPTCTSTKSGIYCIAVLLYHFMQIIKNIAFTRDWNAAILLLLPVLISCPPDQREIFFEKSFGAFLK